MCNIGISLSLSVADLPTIVPPSSKYLVGLWTATDSYLLLPAFPKLLFVLYSIRSATVPSVIVST